MEEESIDDLYGNNQWIKIFKKTNFLIFIQIPQVKLNFKSIIKAIKNLKWIIMWR